MHLPKRFDDTTTTHLSASERSTYYKEDFWYTNGRNTPAVMLPCRIYRMTDQQKVKMSLINNCVDLECRCSLKYSSDSDYLQCLFCQIDLTDSDRFFSLFWHKDRQKVKNIQPLMLACAYFVYIWWPCPMTLCTESSMVSILCFASYL